MARADVSERRVRPFTADDAGALREVMLASIEHDRLPGVEVYDAERTLLAMAGDPSGSVVAVEDGTLCGYATPRFEDLTVHPAFRRHGHGRRLFGAALQLAARANLTELLLYVPEAPAPGHAFARAMGLAYRSSLWLFLLSNEAEVPPAAFPPDVAVRPFGGWLNLGDFVAMMNESFSGHPTPLSWTPAEIAFANAQDDFDPADVLVVTPAGRAAAPIAFVRTRLRPAEEGLPAAGGGIEGEIGLLGVVADWRGRGLGRELLRWGIDHLRAKGAARIRLSVEAENERALGLYRRTGFKPVLEWPHWSMPVSRGAPPAAPSGSAEPFLPGRS